MSIDTPAPRAFPRADEHARTAAHCPGIVVAVEAKPDGARSFQVPATAYDRFMGRYSRPLAAALADAAGLGAGQRALDVGCGPGALTEELVRRLGPDNVAAVDPSQPFVDECRRRNAGVEVLLGRAESLPFGDALFDAALAQLVLHFVADPAAAAAEMRRVLVGGGTVTACVWDFTGGMRMLRAFWDAALDVAPAAPDEAVGLHFGREGEIANLFAAAGFHDVRAGALEVEAHYDDFDDLWAGFMGGAGPAGSFCMSLTDEQRETLRRGLFTRVGEPAGAFSLPARAWYGTGRARS
jgi:SAM-dependent methyltransferase